MVEPKKRFSVLFSVKTGRFCLTRYVIKPIAHKTSNIIRPIFTVGLRYKSISRVKITKKSKNSPTKKSTIFEMSIEKRCFFSSLKKELVLVSFKINLSNF